MNQIRAMEIRFELRTATLMWTAPSGDFGLNGAIVLHPAKMPHEYGLGHAPDLAHVLG